MATYFQGNSEMQAEAEAGGAGGAGGDGLQTLVLMNPGYLQYSPPPPPTSNLLLLNSMAAAQSHQQQFVGIPINPNQQHSMAMHPPQSQSQDVSVLHGFLPRMHYNANNTTSNVWNPNPIPRALSLTLSNGEDYHAPPSSSSSVSVLLTSKYLKAAQELLDEAVHVNNLPTKPPTPHSSPPPSTADASSKPASSDLSASDRQDIQMKKAKLINMLDQVEQRYRQYQQQMHLVISSFDQAAGIGSATTYTSLALHTISKQFRCLKDAITAQIRVANQSLGEEDCLTPKLEGSGLKYVDHHLRQQRALQQLGMIHHNAWRPQRGLPERSVSVLRAWLFEHFLHPYPKDSDKHMLAKQTGLTRSQVSNWFINARVRLWKPMVEEMYMEEMKEQEQDGCHDDKSSKSSEDPSSKKGPAAAASETDAKQDVSCTSNQNNNPTVASLLASSPAGGNVRNQFGFSFMGSSELEGITRASPKKPRNHDMMPPSPTSINMDVKPNEISNDQVSLKFGDDQRQGRDGYSFMENQTNFMGAFGQYPIGEIGRFDAAPHFAPRFSGNGVSLTLGLPHCDTLSGTHHQTFLPNHNNIQLGRRLEMGEANEFGGINPSTPHSSAAAAAFENINMQNPKRFVAQLLPDFVT